MRRTSRARRAPAAVAVGAVVVAFVLGGCSGRGAAPLARGLSPLPTTAHRTGPTDGASTPQRPAPHPNHVIPRDFSAIRQVLARRAAAVLHDNRAAFLATLDPDDAAFRAQELIEFANLQRLPVGSMSYESSDYGLTPAKVPGHGLVAAPQVTEHVLLKGTDDRPVGISVDMTFVRRGTHWYLGSDKTDTGSQGGNSTARPWAGPAIAVVKQGPLLVVADAEPAGVARHMAAVVHEDLVEDAAVLHLPVQQRLLVDVTTGGQVEKFANNEEVGGVTYAVDSMKNNAYTGIAGWRVKINPADLKYLDEDPALLRHELTHYLLRQYGGEVPLWLSEGVAEYVAHQPGGLPTEGMTLADYDRLRRRPHALINSGLFGEDPGTDYPLAMAIVTYLVDRAGIERLITLMKTFAAYNDAPYEDQHDSAALRKVYDLTPAQVADGAFGLLAALW